MLNLKSGRLATILNTLATVLATVHRLTRALLARSFEDLGILIGAAVLLGVSAFIYAVDPTQGSLPLATLQLLALAPLILFLMLHAGIWSYKNFARPWFKYLKSDQPELLGLTLPTPAELLQHGHHDGRTINALVHLHTLKFLIVCARTLFSWLPLLVLLYLLFRLMELSLTLAPR
jgi:hypothetical protein